MTDSEPPPAEIDAAAAATAAEAVEGATEGSTSGGIAATEATVAAAVALEAQTIEEIVSPIAWDDLERSYMQEAAEKESLVEQLSVCKSTLQSVQQENLEWQQKERATAAIQLDLTRTQEKLQSVISTNQHNLERLDRMQAESDNLRAEIRYVW